jgi:pimeloyl-ACP methyl ester carboxylesterase
MHARTSWTRRVAAAWVLTWAAAAGAQNATPAYGQELEGFDYPHPVQHYAFPSQGEPMQMAYMDVAPESGAANAARTVVLLHGKNFCGATWDKTIDVLHEAGFRVVAPDQIGFCKSTKPAHYQYSLAQLAANTHALLAAAGISHAIIVGHSIGGMLAIRYALMYPADVDRLVLVDPLGLEDWRAAGVPFRSLDELYAAELHTSFDSIKQYQLGSYYHGAWRADYDAWVSMLAGLYAGPGHERVAWNQAATSDMIFSQPVVYELDRIRPPTVLMFGSLDRTAPGKNLAPAAIAAQLGNFPLLARRAARRIPNAKLIEFRDLGHAPQVEAPQRFNQALLDALAPH